VGATDAPVPWIGRSAGRQPLARFLLAVQQRALQLPRRPSAVRPPARRRRGTSAGHPCPRRPGQARWARRRALREL